MAALIGSDGQSVREHRRALCRVEGGLQHHGLIHVPPTRLEISGRPDGEVSAGRVKKTAEDRWPVEAREAQPVHRAVTADECSGSAVREQRVIANRQTVRHGIETNCWPPSTS